MAMMVAVVMMLMRVLAGAEKKEEEKKEKDNICYTQTNSGTNKWNQRQWNQQSNQQVEPTSAYCIAQETIVSVM